MLKFANIVTGLNVINPITLNKRRNENFNFC